MGLVAAVSESDLILFSFAFQSAFGIAKRLAHRPSHRLSVHPVLG